MTKVGTIQTQKLETVDGTKKGDWDIVIGTEFEGMFIYLGKQYTCQPKAGSPGVMQVVQEDPMPGYSLPVKEPSS